MISCKKATEYISKHQEKKLSVLQRFQLWLHLLICIWCRRFGKQTDYITRVIQRSPSQNQASLTPEQKASIVNALEQD